LNEPFFYSNSDPIFAKVEAYNDICANSAKTSGDGAYIIPFPLPPTNVNYLSTPELCNVEDGIPLTWEASFAELYAEDGVLFEIQMRDANLRGGWAKWPGTFTLEEEFDNVVVLSPALSPIRMN
jgi:hypothetical protein